LDVVEDAELFRCAANGFFRFARQIYISTDRLGVTIAIDQKGYTCFDHVKTSNLSLGVMQSVIKRAKVEPSEP
jgi:hypothetical protein